MEEKTTQQYVDLAYARISMKDQHLERQEQSIYEAVPNLKAMYFFEDKYTGKSFDRTYYNKLKDKICEIREIHKDIPIRLTIHELDRIGRDYKEIQNEVYWFRQHGVQLNFLDIPTELIGGAMGITGELIVDMVILLKSYWAEQELHVKDKRTREGREAAKAKGVKFGRQPIKVDEKQFREQADRAIARNITHKEAMRNLELKDYVYWKWIKQFYPDYKPNKKKVKKEVAIC